MSRKAIVCAILCLVGYLAPGAAPLRAEWTENGVGICTTIYTKSSPQIASDGNGGAIVTWGEFRTTWNIYAQRVDPNGAILWGAQGTAVCDFVGIQRFPQLVSDGAGGAIVTWYDDRNGNNDVFAQRVDASGAARWATNGVSLSTAAGEQYNVRIVSDGAGGAIVSIYDSGGNGDIYAQRISADGTVLWAANGVAVSPTADNETNPQITPDGAHGVIVAFSRLVNSQYFTFANRVDAAGTVLWAAEGIPVCVATGGQYDLKIVNVGAGSAIATWSDYRGGAHIYAQLVDTTGAVFWGATGAAVCTALGTQETPQIAADGTGGAIITWLDSRNGNADIYAQRMDAAGAVWAANGVAVCAAIDEQSQGQIASDGAGGAVVAWRDQRAGVGDYNIYVQRIDANGAPVWMSDGVVACAAASTQQDPAIVSDGVFGAIVTWTDLRSGFGAIYAHRENPIVATLLESFAACVEGGCVELSWALSEAGADARFFIQRAPGPEREFEEIANPLITHSGLSFGFADCTCEPGDAVRYRVEMEDDDGVRALLFESDVIVLPRATIALFQNRPNPFNPGTTIEYYLPVAGRVALEIYDPAGRVVARLVDAVQAKGSHEVEWNGRNGAGAMVGSGVYFYRLTAGKETLAKKLVLLK